MQLINPVTNSFFRTTNSEVEKLSWLRLIRSQNVGKVTFFRLLDIFGSCQKALENIGDFSIKGGLSRPIKVYSAEEAVKEIENCRKINARIISYTEEIYPKLLREIASPPPILTILGNEDFLNRDQIAVVGPRNPSFNGVAFAKKISAELGSYSLIVTSGMARGIDSAAHKAALASGTVAVTGCGIDKIYPSENQELHNQIARNGLIVTEFSFGTTPQAANFPQRNRIISGLSLGIIVVEAAIKSGTLITANCALEQNREVFAVPGSPFDPRCQGTNRLIKDGATLLDSIEDVLQELPNLRGKFLQKDQLREDSEYEFTGILPKAPNDDDVKKVRDEILSKLSYSQVVIEDLAQELAIPIRLANIAIIQLELADKVEVKSGKVTKKSYEDN